MIRNKGFTLIELLLALAIAALISMGTLFLFNTSLGAKRTIDEQSEYMAQLSRVLRVVEQDFIQLSSTRAIRDPYGEFRPAIELTFEGLFLTRNGWAISQFQSYERSSQQRVHYRLAEPGSDLCPWLDDEEQINDQDKCLIRSYQLQLDDDGSLSWQYQLLLRPVKKIDWQFLVKAPDAESASFMSEPPTEDPRDGVIKNRLQAVKIDLEMGRGQHYERLFSTPTLPPLVESELRT